MAMDQQETFNWLVNEKARLEKELATMTTERDAWAGKAFDLAFARAKDNPAIRKRIEQERKAEIATPDVLNFVLD